MDLLEASRHPRTGQADQAVAPSGSGSSPPIPEYDGLVSTLAYPYSPPEMDRGPLYRFTLNHVVTSVTPTELFRTTTEEL